MLKQCLQRAADLPNQGGAAPVPGGDDQNKGAPVPPASSQHSGIPQGSSKIRTFEQKLAAARHEDAWDRSPNVTGTGAIHVKSFHCKLNEESLHHLDDQINRWLDAHPQYEVKLVTSSIGEWRGKTKEPNLIIQVWV